MDRQSGNKSVVFNHLCYQRFIAGWWLEWSRGTLQFALDFHFVRTWQNLVYKSPIKDSCQSNFNTKVFILHRKQILVSTNFLIFIIECFLFYKTCSFEVKPNLFRKSLVYFVQGVCSCLLFWGWGTGWFLYTQPISVDHANSCPAVNVTQSEQNG